MGDTGLDMNTDVYLFLGMSRCQYQNCFPHSKSDTVVLDKGPCYTYTPNFSAIQHATVEKSLKNYLFRVVTENETLCNQDVT